MGNSQAKLEEHLLDCILTNQEAVVEEILSKHPEIVNAKLVDGKTNPICRASYLNKRGMIAILLKHGANINLKCAGRGNTALMWAAWRNNLKMVEFLFESGADIEALNEENQNALDICIIRMSYETALFLKKKGLIPKPAEYYEDKVTVFYDIPLFIEKLENEELIQSYKIFHERIIREEKEWLSKDLVIDPRESWKEWFVRNANFDEPPFIPREEIPEHLQPHQTFYGKLTCYLNGINPYPPGHKYN